MADAPRPGGCHPPIHWSGASGAPEAPIKGVWGATASASGDERVGQGATTPRGAKFQESLIC
eukprot:1393144-Alexandrium_andersonii.AAC.1